MTRVRIFRPARNTMQSGLAKTKSWIMEYELETARLAEPLMGWISSGDTLNQVRLRFNSAEQAVAYAKSRGWDYTVSPEHAKKLRPRNYVQNFVYRPFQDDTAS